MKLTISIDTNNLIADDPYAMADLLRAAADRLGEQITAHADCASGSFRINDPNNGTKIGHGEWSR